MEVAAAAFPVTVLVLSVVAGMLLYAKANANALGKTEETMGNGWGRPSLTWFCDSEMNARDWLDFGARNTEELNRGYLQVSLEALRATQAKDFAIHILAGRDAILAAIPRADPQAKQLPPALFRMWALANLCLERGGLVMDGTSTLCVGPSFADRLQGVEAATFGVNPDEPVANPTTALAPPPAPYVGYARRPGHPGWTYTTSVLNSVVASGPTAWSAALARRIASELYPKQVALGMSAIRDADGGRLANGKARQLEDLLGRVASPPDPNTALTPGTIYVPFDGDAVIRRYEFAWFVRMSPEQIKESELVWASYAGC